MKELLLLAFFFTSFSQALAADYVGLLAKNGHLRPLFVFEEHVTRMATPLDPNFPKKWVLYRGSNKEEKVTLAGPIDKKSGGIKTKVKNKEGVVVSGKLRYHPAADLSPEDAAWTDLDKFAKSKIGAEALINTAHSIELSAKRRLFFFESLNRKGGESNEKNWKCLQAWVLREGDRYRYISQTEGNTICSDGAAVRPYGVLEKPGQEVVFYLNYYLGDDEPSGYGNKLIIREFTKDSLKEPLVEISSLKDDDC